MHKRTRLLAPIAITIVAIAATASPAGACGGLIGENGSIQLERTTTLAAWHDGVEHYITSFSFSGTGESVGSIIPLPAVPTKVEAAGQWTLQRLQREIAPPIEFAAGDARAASQAGAAEVILTAQVDALDITVLKGGGDEVGKWALDNGFFLTPDAPEVLDFYAARSPIFLAAKFDAARAAAQGLNGGDGTPIDITIPIDKPWVPLRILSLGLPGDTAVNADVFLLTDDKPDLIGGPGLRLDRSEAASSSLMTDLRSDRNTDWMPAHMWLSHLALDDAAQNVRYDLSVGTDRSGPTYVAAGRATNDLFGGAIVSVVHTELDERVTMVVGLLGALLLGTLIIGLSRRRHRNAA